MNCKPGDLAFYVGRTSPQDIGAVVRCVRFVGNQYTILGALLPMWEISPPLQNAPASRKDWCADKALRPILDPGEDAADEMVALLGKPASQPSKEHA